MIDENPPRPAQEWPNLFVVGAARAGTTSLWAYLDDHPEIFMSRLKEPHFFSRMHIPFLPYVHDEISYKALFANAGDKPFRGEASELPVHRRRRGGDRRRSAGRADRDHASRPG